MHMRRQSVQLRIHQKSEFGRLGLIIRVVNATNIVRAATLRVIRSSVIADARRQLPAFPSGVGSAAPETPLAPIARITLQPFV
jgi:hypothetical protein